MMVSCAACNLGCEDGNILTEIDRREERKNYTIENASKGKQPRSRRKMYLDARENQQIYI